MSDAKLTEFGELIRKNRKRMKMTQRQLAEKLGVTSGYISLLENGREKLSLGRARQLDKILHARGKIMAGTKRLPGPRGAPADEILKLIERREQKAKLAERVLGAAARAHYVLGALGQGNINDARAVFNLFLYRELAEGGFLPKDLADRIECNTKAFLMDRAQWVPDTSLPETPFHVYWRKHNADAPLQKLEALGEFIERKTSEILSRLEERLRSGATDQADELESFVTVLGGGVVAIPVYPASTLGGQDWSSLADSAVIPAGVISIPKSILGDRRPFAVSLPDGAMSPRYRKGSILLVEAATRLELGKCLLVEVEGCTSPLFRQILSSQKEGEIRLRPTNPDFPEATIMAETIRQCARMIGALLLGAPPSRQDQFHSTVEESFGGDSVERF